MRVITIRPIRQEDMPIVAGWVGATPLWQRYGLDALAVQTQVGRAFRQGDLLLAADLSLEQENLQDQACGFAWCIRKGAFGRSVYLRLIGVRPDRAGAGIGVALLAEVERQVVQDSADLFLLVSDFNTAAQRFYRRQGYVQVGAIPGYVLPDVTELIFRKRLLPMSVE